MFAARKTDNVSSAANYIEDVFSTHLHSGSGTTTSLNVGVDLSTYGGLVWSKTRSGANSHGLIDTARGVNQQISTNSTAAQNATYTDRLTAFTTTGFTLGADASGGEWNQTGYTYVKWIFREQAKFFDVVTYTGDGNTSQTINHNLGSTPGCIIVKNLSSSLNWFVYHTSIGATKHLNLNTTSSATTSSASWNDTAPTSTQFTVGANSNQASNNYVAFLFAHNAGGFGLTGTDNVISCGSFTADGSGNATVNLGYEPQWVMIKASSTTAPWNMFDVMRGMAVGGSGSNNDQILQANSANAETASYGCDPSSTGFIANGWGASQTYIYIAIRRGPMKTPTSGTSVFGLNARSGTGANATVTGGAGVTDLAIIKRRDSTGSPFWVPRLAGTGYMLSDSTGAEAAAGTTLLQANPWDVMDGIKIGTTSGTVNASGFTYINYLIDRAPGFFDVVVVTTNGQASAITSTHNLGVVPEMMIAKKRGPTGGIGDWMVYHKDLNGSVTPQNYRIRLNSTGGEGASSGVWNNTAPTATQFTIGTDGDVNSGTAGDTTVVFLFATVAGVSKVGSYTGNGSSQTINCGFAAGARFILIKRRDATGGDWYVWDTARGIVSGNDPYLLINSTAAEVTGTDYIDPLNAGFEISSTAPAAINANGGTFIFLAIS